MSIIELKATAYDLVLQIDYLQKKLLEVNTELKKRIEDEEKLKVSGDANN